jgi:hypothetical protein
MPGIEEFTKDFFNKSSNSWMKNKIRRGHSMVYVCIAITKDGKPCSRGSILKDATSEHLCKQHRKYHINKIAKDE